MKRLLAVVFALCALVADLSAAIKPNLVIFIADDFSFNDVGAWGSPDAKTPNLDRLATEGMKLTRLYTAAPTCSPTRAALYTGLYPIKNGAHPNHSSVKPGTKSVAHYLKPLGYRVGIVGKTMIRPPDSFPFDLPSSKKTTPIAKARDDDDEGGEDDDLDFDAIEKYIAKDKAQPFCLVVASHQPHGPWNKGDPTAYQADKLTLPPYLVDTQEVREERTHYLAEVTFLDSEVGRVLELLKQSGQSDNTLFLFLSEQGAGLPGAKYNLYDPGIRSAAIARWPGKIKPGSQSDALASYVDVVPTFVEAAGDKEIKGLDGRSFLPVLFGKAKKHSAYVFAQATSLGVNGVETPYAIRAVRDERYKYIWNLNHENAFPCNRNAHQASSSWAQLALTNSAARDRLERFIHRPEVELFDLKNDPWEQKNLADDPAHRDTLKCLRKELHGWMKDQGDEGIATELAVEKRLKPKNDGKKGKKKV